MPELLADKRVAYGLIAVGVVAVFLSILIDPLRGYDIYLAASQIVVIIVGIVLTGAGAYLAFMYQPPEAE